MNRFAVYSPVTGTINRVVECPEQWAEMQAQEGEAVIPCAVTVWPWTHRVQGGQLEPLPPPPPPTAEEIRFTLATYAQRHLDETARSWGYDDIRSACTYVGDPFPRFAAEGLALRDWRSAVWAHLDALSAAPLPDPMPDRDTFLASLPAAPSRPVV